LLLEKDRALRLKPATFSARTQEVWREKSGAPRTAFAAHKFNKVFEVMSRQPRLVEPLMQLSASGLRHQFKLNARPPSRVMSGSGIRITAPGRATTACRNRER